jgi:hypothetical protein
VLLSFNPGIVINAFCLIAEAKKGDHFRRGVAHRRRVPIPLEVGVEFYQYDTIDHEEICMGSDEITRQVTLNVEVFLLCHGDLFVESVDKWEVDIEITGGEYLVEIGEVNPDYDEHEE